MSNCNTPPSKKELKTLNKQQNFFFQTFFCLTAQNAFKPFENLKRTLILFSGVTSQVLTKNYTTTLFRLICE